MSTLTITIDSSGNDTSSCCELGECSCSSLDLALLYCCNSDQVIINITSESVLLTSIPSVSSLNAFMIIGSTVGNGTVVMCNDIGAIRFYAINNVTLLNVIWDRCGNPVKSSVAPGGVFVNRATLTVKNCVFQNAKSRALYINVATASIESSAFVDNYAGALHVSFCDPCTFTGNITFKGNSAVRGGAILAGNHTYMYWINAFINFTNNDAELYGGAVFVDLNFPCYFQVGFFRDVTNTVVSFIGNQANTGNSFYFGLAVGCYVYPALLMYPSQFHYPGNLSEEIGTTVYQLQLFSPAVCINNHLTSNNCTVGDFMLGQEIIIPAQVEGFFGNTAEPSQYFVSCIQNCVEHSLSGDDVILIGDNYLRGISIIGKPLLSTSTTSSVTLKFTLIRNSVLIDNDLLSLNLVVNLTTCFSGFEYSVKQKKCVCYDRRDGIVRCNVVDASIKQGYWFGTVKERATVTICPNNYCNFTSCNLCIGFCNLSRAEHDQCRAHRTGPACGNCKPGYVLPFDSTDCIPNSRCSIGMTTLLMISVVLYWFILITILIVLMNYSFLVGYAYGIIYFYSVIDLLYKPVSNDTLFKFLSILSGFAKLIPKFLGTLCLTDNKEWSGIDQQFFHFVHPVAVAIILLTLTIAARYSVRLSRYISRSIIRAICLILLLTYTSVASSSLELLQAVVFEDIDVRYTYSSPDIRFFHGRHAFYATIAILFELVIVIGLPLVLLLEPFLRRRISFFRLKPMLDQYQACYKDRYHYFAAYYLFCRQAMLIVAYSGVSNYYDRFFIIQTLSIVIVIIHALALPYKNKALNVLDLIILLIASFIVTFNVTFTFTSFQSTSSGWVYGVVIFPLICFAATMLIINMDKLKSCFVSKHQEHAAGEFDMVDGRGVPLLR